VVAGIANTFSDVTDIGNVSRNCHYENTCNLNILSLNCCGVKLRLQYPAFCELVCNQDIICLQETKTDDLDTNHFQTIQGHQFQYY
jgi:hypothetical protein